MLNALWPALLAIAIASGAYTGRLDQVAEAAMQSSVQAAELALRLIGPMALWLGLVRVLHTAQITATLARPIGWLFARLFPKIPADDPSLGLMTLNMTSNVLGLGNAATPFGLKAMRALQRHSPDPHVASDAMVMFLVINTAGLAVLPTGMIALRATLGSAAPGAIFLPTILSTIAATLVGIAAASLLSRLSYFREPAAGAAPRVAVAAAASMAADAGDETLLGGPKLGAPSARARLWAAAFAALTLGALAWATWRSACADGLAPALRHAMGSWSLLALMALFVAAGAARGIAVYDAVVAGGREAFDVAKQIIPYLVAMLVVTGMLRASGAIDAVTTLLAPVVGYVGLPPEALPMALLRPLTGTGAYGLAADLMRVHGPDTLVGEVVSTLMGTTETTFYVLALYLGSVGVRQVRHTLWACLFSDLGGTLMAAWSCRWLLH